MTLKFSDKQLARIFAFIFPIMPLYYEILGINGINIICFLFVIMAFAIHNLKIRTIISTDLLFLSVLVWIAGRCLCYAASKNFTEILFFVLRISAVYVVLNSIIRCKTNFLCLIRTVILSGVFVSCFGIVEEITKFNIFSLIHPTGELNYNPLRFGILRILSFSSHTIVYGVYLMFVMSLCLYYMQFIRNNKETEVRYRIAYLLLWVNMMLTLSRSIMICAFLSQIVILYLMRDKKFLSICVKCFVIGIPVILIFCLVVPPIRNGIRNMFYMILVVFDADFSAKIAAVFGGDNLLAYGDRLNLYTWVAQELDGSWIFGKGMNASFSHAYLDTDGVNTWTAYKTSIEVQYLNILFRYGLVGMITECLMYASLLITAIKGKVKKTSWETEIGFNSVAFIVFFMYFVEFFAVNQSSDQSIFYIFVMVFAIYNRKRSVWKMG